MDQPVNINSATMRALVNAERERRERYAKQMEETKNILTDFIQRVGEENNIQIPESVKTRLNLVEVAKFAIELANLIMIRQKNAISDYSSTNPNDLKARIAELERENKSLKIQVETRSIPAAPAPVDRPADSVTAPAVEKAQPIPMPDLLSGSVEDRVIQVAGSIHSIRLGGLVAACEERLGLPAAEIEDAIHKLVGNRLIEVYHPNLTPRRGEEYPPVFELTDSGANLFTKSSSKPAIRHKENLRAEKIWEEEAPLLAFLFEELLPRQGYSFVRYLPEIGVFTPERGNHIFRPHVQLCNSDNKTLYAMYAGKNYMKGDVGRYLDDFSQADGGRMYFVAVNTRIARQVSSDINYILRGKPMDDVRTHVSNLDDLIQYDRDKAAGNITAKDIWFVALRRSEK